ncbi:hypothetical protein G3545_25920 [Starkeya sp. ORNL1]|uniref:hypothetical protein n=1 Tax=Starkeya sp. ORNL1 TaxID=2709380 RepID=UPI001463B68B|nr:hypothetical protein [Starkeya sp. ORNL1]QJP16775.1 hypothetical protein G3545_25920 [Starkeya sp. ORNL1]
MTRTHTAPRMESGKGVLSMIHAVFHGFRFERAEEPQTAAPPRQATEIDIARAELMVAAIHARSVKRMN